MGSMKYKMPIQVLSILVFIGLRGTITLANEIEGIQFGTFITKSDIWNKYRLGIDFSPEQALELNLDDETVLFYHDEPSWEAFVIVLQQTQKRILWKTERLLPSRLVPVPVLVAGLFNNNQKPDILFCLSIDQRIGKNAEHWEQSMYIFGDGQRNLQEPIILSFVDWEGGEQIKDSWYKRKDSLIMILPAWGVSLTKTALEQLSNEIPNAVVQLLTPLADQVFADDATFFQATETLIGKEQTTTYQQALSQSLAPAPGSIYVWSRIRTIEQAEVVTYQLERYDIQEQQVLPMETVTGNYQATSEKVRTAMQARREQADAPAPVLLNFLKHAPEYLCEEDEWFQYWEQQE